MGTASEWVDELAVTRGAVRAVEHLADRRPASRYERTLLRQLRARVATLERMSVEHMSDGANGRGHARRDDSDVGQDHVERLDAGRSLPFRRRRAWRVVGKREDGAIRPVGPESLPGA
jgi:hypothetical protein